MSLKRLTVHNLRNLRQVDIQPSSEVNLIYGENGSGKTSLLESINLLSLGRSFRSHKIKPIINEHADALTVFGRVDADAPNISMGVSRVRRGEPQFKVAGKPIGSLAELASLLPLQVINADAFQLLVGGPKERRQFLDWLVFHVEPTFFQVWKSAQRCLKHRNSMLRHGRIDTAQLSAWDRELVACSETIHSMRQRCFDKLLTCFEGLVEEFVAAEGLSLSLYAGWPKDQRLSDGLSESLERDIRQGFTGSGFHRADIKIKVGAQAAGDILSRGQQKLLVCALKVAQGMVYAQVTGRKCVFLVDDLPAELDEGYRGLLVKWLDHLKTQVFITGVERSSLLQHWQSLENKDIRVFHVEHGQIANEETTIKGGLPQ